MKKKVALFYDQNTESGRMILDFLTPFDKRKSDIVGQLILKWISENGASVPVEWLGKRSGELNLDLSLPVRPSCQTERPGKMAGAALQGAGVERKAAGGTEERADIRETMKEDDRAGEAPHDKGLVLAGLSSFMGQKGE